MNCLRGPRRSRTKLSKIASWGPFGINLTRKSGTRRFLRQVWRTKRAKRARKELTFGFATRPINRWPNRSILKASNPPDRSKRIRINGSTGVVKCGFVSASSPFSFTLSGWLGSLVFGADFASARRIQDSTKRTHTVSTCLAKSKAIALVLDNSSSKAISSKISGRTVLSGSRVT